METLVEERIFNLAIFLLTSARGLLDEPPVYGPMRLLEALSMVLELKEEAPELEQNGFLNSVKHRLDKREYVPSSKLLTSEGREWFKSYLDEMIIDFAREAKKRKAT